MTLGVLPLAPERERPLRAGLDPGRIEEMQGYFIMRMYDPDRNRIVSASARKNWRPGWSAEDFLVHFPQNSVAKQGIGRLEAFDANQRFNTPQSTHKSAARRSATEAVVSFSPFCSTL